MSSTYCNLYNIHISQQTSDNTHYRETLIYVTIRRRKLKTCSCDRAKIKLPNMQIQVKSTIGTKTVKPLNVLL